jgi:hypothetical protein
MSRLAFALLILAASRAAAAPTPAECYARFEGVPHDRRDYTVFCQDGDPGCDADGQADGGCTIRLEVCALGRGGAACRDHRSLPLKLSGAHIPLPRRLPRRRACGRMVALRVPLEDGGRKPGRLFLHLFTGQRLHPRTFDRLDLRCQPTS